MVIRFYFPFCSGFLIYVSYGGLCWPTTIGDSELLIEFLSHCDQVLDGRVLNGRKEAQEFAEFWITAEELVNEDMNQTQSKRHEKDNAHCAADKVSYLPLALSTGDFREMVCKKLVEKNGPSEEWPSKGIRVPSENWVRYAMLPPKESSVSSIQYTEKLKLKFRTQSKSIRLFNEDTHYARAVIKSAKMYACSLVLHDVADSPELVVYLSLDDKAKSPYGHPGDMISTGVRARSASLVPDGMVLAALDHDMITGGKVTVTGIFQVDLPKKSSESFYHGSLTMSQHCSITQPSDPFRHAASVSSYLLN